MYLSRLHLDLKLMMKVACSGSSCVVFELHQNFQRVYVKQKRFRLDMELYTRPCKNYLSGARDERLSTIACIPKCPK